MDLKEVFLKFPTRADCITCLEDARWQGKPTCPYCDSDKVTHVHKENRYHCNKCNTTFSVTVNTLFHHTRLPLQKWFLAICMMLEASQEVSTKQLASDLNVNKKTASYIEMRIRQAMALTHERQLITKISKIERNGVKNAVNE
jgi:transposase-like protein